jgi:hypothetical protein
VHDDEKFDEFLRGAAKDYKASSDAHAGDIWAAIAPDVAKAINPQRRFPASLRTATWVGIGIAATLMIGVGVGRWSNRPDAQQQQQHVAVQHPAPVNDDSSAHVAHVRATAIEHLADAEVFLTTVRADMKAGRTEADRAERSRELLARTRLLLGSTSNATPNVKRLLEDLELLLAEIAAMPPSHSSMDKTLLDESMREGNIIPRIRATLPAQQAGS